MDQFNDNDVVVPVASKRNAVRFKDECSTSKPVKKGRNLRDRSNLDIQTPKREPRQSFTKKGPRSVLSWLIHSGVVSLGEEVHFRSPNNDNVLKNALLTREGLVCLLCNETLSISEFEIHTGFNSKTPSMNLVMESGKPFTSCLLEAWSAEYNARKSPLQTIEADDLCGICGLEGDLVCCDGCPATFHPTCLSEKEIPEGNWYCQRCSCRTCSHVGTDKDPSVSPRMICTMCENHYHETCKRGKDVNTGVTSNQWFCGESCHEIHEGLQSRIGLMNHISDELSWTLLRCMDGDLRTHSSRDFLALKAECNSKLAVAITILQENFKEMVDMVSKIDMTPQMIYNRGSRLPRLNFKGFYTVVLEKNDAVVCVASLRIHGMQVAELPFIATCNKFVKQGMCRLLISHIEELLRNLKVDKLAVPASGDKTRDMWVNKFGFEPMEEAYRKKFNFIVLPESPWLVKSLAVDPLLRPVISSWSRDLIKRLTTCRE